MLVTRVGINDRIDTFASLTKEIEPASFNGNLIALTTLQLTAKQQREFIAALDGDIYRRLPKARMALVLRLEALVSDGSKKQTFEARLRRYNIVKRCKTKSSSGREMDTKILGVTICCAQHPESNLRPE